MTERTTVWIGPSATAFSCLCGECLEHARTEGLLFGDALRDAIVRGPISPATLLLAVRCRRGHELVLRRVELPPALAQTDPSQLQLA